MDVTLLNQDATTHIALIKDKQISAQELAQEQYQYIARYNQVINAFISLAEDDFPLQEPHTGSLFEGICLGIKDNIDVVGFNTTAGMATRRENAPLNDAFVIARLRQMGARFIGKLNMHEGALGATNDNAHFGRCHNPHQIGYTPGGSSGGSAAAVASGMVSLALGTDTMGSVRIPASYCGIFGFKPSRGAVSNNGSVACCRVMDCIGPMARSARDLTLAMNVMSGFDSECPASPDVSFTHNLSPSQRKVLLVPQNLQSLGVEQSIVEDFESNLDAFIALGYNIVNFDLSDYNFTGARRAGLLLCEADMRVEHQQDWQQHPDKFSPYLRGMLEYIETKTPMDIMRAERVLDEATLFARHLFSMGTAILMPTTLQRAFSFDAATPANQADLTSFANQAGLPAVSLPMLSRHSLPAGMQLVGPVGSDSYLLNLAERWQQQTGFSYQIPNID